MLTQQLKVMKNVIKNNKKNLQKLFYFTVQEVL